jgi:hypothetical protein
MSAFTHVATSGGLIFAAFIENVRQPGSRSAGLSPSPKCVGPVEAPVFLR